MFENMEKKVKNIPSFENVLCSRKYYTTVF